MKFAGILALVGPPGDREAQEVFEAFSRFLLTKRRVRRAERALAGVHASREGVLRVARALRTWGRLTGGNLDRGACDPVSVLAVAGQVPDSERYVEHLRAKGLTSLAQVFHPRTLEHAKGEVRGLFAGTSDYWQRTRHQLNVIDD